MRKMHLSATFIPFVFFSFTCRVQLTGVSEPFRASQLSSLSPPSLLQLYFPSKRIVRCSVHADSKTVGLRLLAGVSALIVKAGVVWPVQVAAVRDPASTAAGGSTCGGGGAADSGQRSQGRRLHLPHVFFFVCVCVSVFISSLDRHLAALPVRLLHAAAVVCHREPGPDWPTGPAEAAGGDSGRRADAEYRQLRSERGVIVFSNPVASLSAKCLLFFSRALIIHGASATSTDLRRNRRSALPPPAAGCSPCATACHRICESLSLPTPPPPSPPQTQEPATRSATAGLTCLRSWLLW